MIIIKEENDEDINNDMKTKLKLKQSQKNNIDLFCIDTGGAFIVIYSLII